MQDSAVFSASGCIFFQGWTKLKGGFYKEASWLRSGRQCITLLASEAPTSPTVCALLASEIGTRAAEGNIGRVNRWFAGRQHIEEVEALCVELLKLAFRFRYTHHRLMGNMLGNMAVYHAMTQPDDKREKWERGIPRRDFGIPYPCLLCLVVFAPALQSSVPVVIK